MPDRARVLITGSQGFIGKALAESLRDAGYDVWGVDLAGDPECQVVAADLLDLNATREAIEAAGPFSVLIHTAALTHRRAAPRGQSCLSINVKLTENVLRAVQGQSPRMIFLSSVSVYGEYGRHGPVATDEDLRPATEYGKSKVLCEQRIFASDLEHCDLLRLAPVYDDAQMNNVRKRVFLPGLGWLKTHIHPPPEHSLCHLSTVARTVVDLLRHPPTGRRVLNVADAKPYGQHELASWFPGPSVPLPACLLRPVSWLSFLLPKRYGYPLRCLYWKLFCPNVYTTVPMRETRLRGRANSHAC